MKPELKQKWIKALRSGKYQQGRYKLYSRKQYGEYYCCLGVLRHINDPSDERMGKGVLTIKQLEEFDLSISAQEKLARMNDNGYSFNQIADFIEENVRGKNGF